MRRFARDVPGAKQESLALDRGQPAEDGSAYWRASLAGQLPSKRLASMMPGPRQGGLIASRGWIAGF